MKKLWLMTIVLVLTLVWLHPLSAQDGAQDVEIREDHPGEYVVQEGDTLWDIAGRFLTRPWQWPAIWQANPQIDNPHLIYPGDRLSLVYIDGEPRLLLNADTAITRLSPRVRREDISGPVISIPFEQIEPFLEKPRMLSAEELAETPYVVANQDQDYFTAKPSRIFVRGMNEFRVGDEVVVSRLNAQFVEYEDDGEVHLRQNQMRRNRGAVPYDERPIDPDPGFFSFFDKGEVVGYQLWEVARA
ncbi:MAG: LysM domain-containing protein, partial [Pseudomonadota bacterium]